MLTETFDYKLRIAVENYIDLLNEKNAVLETSNGWYERYKYPVLTKTHVPIYWKYDLDRQSNPYFMEKLGVSCVFNPCAIELTCVEQRIELIKRPEAN